MCQVRNLILVLILVFLLFGCATIPTKDMSLPPRYIEPSLPVDRLALVVAKGNGIGIILVDGAIVCDPSDYSLEGLKKAKPGSSVRLSPGPHELTFGCWLTSESIRISTKMTVLEGKRYKAICSFRGYSVSVSVQLEE